ncbi:MAG: hypothetical protein U0992_22570 [Planctomycetaceae bacterium]
MHIHDRHPEHAEGQLALHIQAYHEAEPVEAVPDWHVHFMLPQDVMRLGDCPSPNEAPEDPLLAQQTLLQLAGPPPSLNPLLADARIAGGPADFPTAMSAKSIVAAQPMGDDVVCWKASFVTSLLLAAPLRAVTGVALC